MFPRAGARYRARRPLGGPGATKVLAYGAALCGAFLAWYAVWGGAFRISDIQVSGVSAPTEQAIRAGISSHMDGTLLGFLPRSNALFFGATAAMDDIAKNVVLDKISVRTRLPHTVLVTADEKIARAAYDRDGRLYALDQDGVVIRELSADETALLGVLPPGMDAIAVPGLGAQTVNVGSANAPAATPVAATAAPSDSKRTMPLIRSSDAAALTGSAQDDSSVVPGATPIPAAAMNLVLQAHVRLPDIVGEPIQWFTVQPSSETVEATTASGWQVLMSTALPFDAQGDRLGIVLKDKIGSKRSSLQYVDLRYNERIFFRLKDGTSQ